MRRMLAILMAAALLVCALPLTASANTAVGEFKDADLSAKARDASIYNDPHAAAELAASVITAYVNQIDDKAATRISFYREAYIGTLGKTGYIISIMNKDDSFYLFTIRTNKVEYMLYPYVDPNFTPSAIINYLTYYYSYDYQPIDLYYLRAAAGPMLGMDLPDPMPQLATLEEPSMEPTPTPKPKVQIRRQR